MQSFPQALSRKLLSALALLLACAGPCPAQGNSAWASHDSPPLSALLNPRIRALDEKIRKLEGALDELPGPPRIQSSYREGFHSLPLDSPDEPQWLQIDFGESRPIDLVALVPVNVEAPLTPSGGYGFPLRFRVEVSNVPNPNGARVLADYTREDFPNPGDMPVLIEGDGQPARWLRVTSTRHFPVFDHHIWALSEVIALSGNYNVAANARVKSTNSASHASIWRAANVTDGDSPLGVPEIRDESSTNGWRSSDAQGPDSLKWVTVDLGEPQPVDEVRFLPAYPTDTVNAPGLGFPSRYRITAGLTADGSDHDVVKELSRAPQPAPSDSAIVVRLPGEPVRYIRMEAHSLRTDQEAYVFALAEIQAYVKGRNIAEGASVLVSDFPEEAAHPGWAPEFLTDGFSSRYRLTEWPVYLRQLERKCEIMQELVALRLQRTHLSEQILTIATASTSFVFITATGFLGLALMRSRRARSRESMRIREQIASDLHDDIGSNLGSITLLSQLSGAHGSLPDELRKDLTEIREIAGRTNESMRDIVWLIQDGDGSYRELISRIREVIHRFTEGRETKVTIRPETLAAQPSPSSFAATFFFAFKETMNNLCKHSESSRVTVEIEAGKRQFRFQVFDNGCGFDPASTRPGGIGLQNLRKRATALGGECRIESNPGHGTTVTFTVPFR